MFEAYKIGVRIGVLDATRGSVLKIALQFAKANREASAFLKTLLAVNAELRRPTSWASSAANDFRETRRQAEGYARAANSARATSGVAAGMGLVAVGAAAGLARGVSRLPMLAYGGGGGGGAPLMLSGPSGGPRWLRLSSGGFRMLAGGAGGGGGGRDGGGGFRYGPLGKVFMGYLGFEAGRDMLGMLRSPIESATEYQQAQARFKIFGLGDTLNKEAFKFADSMNVVGTSVLQATDFMTEAQGVFRESGLKGSAALAGAKLAAPVLAKIHYATAGLDSASRAKMDTQALDMMRFIESFGGLSSPKRFNELANEGWKAIRSSGGNVNWSQLRQFLSRASVAGKGLDDVALFGELEPIIGEMKGGAAGQGLMTAYSRLNGLQRFLPVIMTREMTKLGLWKKADLVMNKGGHVKSFKGNPLEQGALFASDPVQWYEKVVLPAYAKAGIKDRNEIFRENAILFGNTGGKFFSNVYQFQGNIAHSVEAQRKTMGIAASDKQVSKTFAGNMLNFTAAWNNFKIAFGADILPMITRGLEAVTPWLKSFAKWAHDSPTEVKALAIAFAGLGAAVMFGGVVIALSGAFGGLRLALSEGGGLANMVGGLTGKLGGLGGVLAKLGVAGVAGYATGSYMWKHWIEGTSVGRGIGDAEYHALHWFGGDAAKQHAIDVARGKQIGQQAIARQAAMYGHGSHVAPARKGTVTHVTNVNLDGKQLARVVTQHQMDEATAPQSGTTGFDSSQFASPSGIAWAY